MTDRFKLVRLIPVLDFGGVETVLEIWSRFADRERYDLRVCTFWKAGAAAETIRANGVAVDVLDVDPSIRNWRATAALARYLRRVRPDILQASIGEANFHAALVGKACGVPVVIIEEHGIPDRPLPYRLVHAALYRMVDAIVGVSQVALDYVVDREFAPRARAHLLYNAVPDAYFRPVAPRVRSDNLFRFVTVGRLHAVKNHDLLIRAFLPVARAHDHARLLIVGGGELHDALAKRVAELQLDSQVTLLGYRSDVQALVEKADCFVLPSLTEAFGIAVVEAMARAIPVIASAGGALPEIVGDIGHCWIVDPLDIDGWSRAMRTMITLNENARSALGHEARTIAERYSPTSHADALHTLYDGLLFDKRPRPQRPR